MRGATCALVTTACLVAGCGDRGPDTPAPEPVDADDASTDDASTAPATPAPKEHAASSSDEPSAADRAQSEKGAAAATIGMTNDLVYTPDSVTITAGETIRWVNDSFLVHTVTCDPARAIEPEKHVALPEGAETFHSGKMAQGDAYSRSFPVAGEYTYFCVPHETDGMVATITVEPKE